MSAPPLPSSFLYNTTIRQLSKQTCRNTNFQSQGKTAKSISVCCLSVGCNTNANPCAKQPSFFMLQCCCSCVLQLLQLQKETTFYDVCSVGRCMPSWARKAACCKGFVMRFYRLGSFAGKLEAFVAVKSYVESLDLVLRDNAEASASS